MSIERTQQQTDQAIQRSVELSLKRVRPPAEVEGYEIERFLGSGAYGEVWVGMDRTTRRRVAIKFFTARSGLDFSLLSAEVEKLVYLSADRYVVQLLDVGWKADPPYYVMDYIENGSLEEALRDRGTFTIAESLELFEEMGNGLMHLHNRGILHCDLKPGNVLLDHEHKPRLADFGQSRLAHEQSPSLGTLFYMAPEQADLNAIPDARWDVYALGAVVYTLLTGFPPHRDEDCVQYIESGEDVPDRLARYRASITDAGRPTHHRLVRGVDRALADIIERCLDPNPNARFDSIQSVMLALRQREVARSRTPLMILGFVGPLLMICIMILFGVGLHNQAVQETDQGLKRKAVESNGWAAQFAARSASEQVERYFSAVEMVSQNTDLIEELKVFETDEEALALRTQIADPHRNQDPQMTAVQDRFFETEARLELQEKLEQVVASIGPLQAASWFVCDENGTQVASIFNDDTISRTVGKNFSFRTYFAGGDEDLITKNPDGSVQYDVAPYREPRQHVVTSHLSAVFASQASGAWKVAFSSPIYDADGNFEGIVAVTVEMGNFIEFENRRQQFAMLVDGRDGPNRGVILEHPLFTEILRSGRSLPDRFGYSRVEPSTIEEQAFQFKDPLAEDPLYEADVREWVAAKRPVLRRIAIEGQPTAIVETGLFVIALEDAEQVVQPAHELGDRMAKLGLLSLVVVVAVVVLLWLSVLRILRESRQKLVNLRSGLTELPSVYTAPTLDSNGADRSTNRV